MPMINPIKAKEKHVKQRNRTITSGWAICKGTNKVEVNIMIQPIKSDLVAAAPTYPETISTKLIGEDNSSYIVPENLGK
jgi:hypothetical protein